MSTKKFLALASILALSTSLQAQYIQEDAGNAGGDPKKFKISSIRLSTGMLVFSTGGSPYDRILGHSPHQSTLRALDAGYDWYSGNYLSVSTSFAPFIGLGFHPYSKSLKDYNKCREIYAGIGILRGSESTDAYKETKVGTDTVVRSHVDYQEQLRSVFVLGSYTYRTDPARRISLHIGFGMAFGSSYSSNLVRSTFVDSSLAVKVGNNTQYFSLNDNYNHESRSYGHSRAYSAKVFVPWGAELRLAKTRPVWSNLVISFEMQAGLLLQNFTRGESTTSDFANTAIGVKYRL